jgi:hypothetical protein
MELREWLLDNDCPIVAMESTGVVLGPRKAIYAIIKNGEEYKELGEDYLGKRNARKKMTILRRKAKELGFALVPVT